MQLRLKYVGIGLFLAGLLFTLNSQFNFIASGSTETSNKKALENKEREIEKLHKQLQEATEEKKNTKINENKGKEENTSNASNTSPETNNSTSSDNDKGADRNTSTEKENGVVTGTVFIYENMSLYDIGQQVEDLKLIENGRQLELYLSKPEYSRSIQKGAFELSSDMTLEEMAKTLTATKPK